MTVTSGRPGSQRRTAAAIAIDRAGALVVLAVAALWLLTSLFVIANFHLRYPAFDQYHFYPKYLEMPFPASAMQLENGHRTFLPTLVRLAEINVLDGGQGLQMVLGLLAVGGILALIAIAFWRERASLTQAATAALIATLGVAWLGNARMLIHSNEILHVYFVVFFALSALSCVYMARGPHRWRWTVAAGLLCLCATFSFGSGIAAFAAALFMTAMLRLRSSQLAALAGFLVVAVALYVTGMPDGAGVRGSMAIQPLENISIGLRWLAAPWMHAWLGMADPPLYPWLPTTAAATPIIGDALVDSSQTIATRWGTHWLLGESLAVGSIGVLAWITVSVHAWRRRGELTRSALLALGIATLGLCVGAIVCLARLEHFKTSPGDVLAERYLPWSCLFWTGIALYAVASARSRSLAATLTLALSGLMLALVLLPTHRTWAGWAATVHRNNEQGAVAAQMGIWDRDRFPDGEDASKSDVLRTLELLRWQKLSMFNEPGYAWWRDRQQASVVKELPLPAAYARAARRFEDDQGRTIVAFEGRVSRIEGLSGDAILPVVDAAGMLRGMAKFGFLDFDKPVLRLNIPQKRGFDGYVVAPIPGEALRVLVIEPDTAKVLAQIPLDL